jgi:serine/threonine-protein kinase
MLGRVFLGRYEIVRLLGEGGMGRVYLAHQLDLGRQVVLKIMHDRIAADSKFRDRFTRETLAMARFQHPFAVTLYDASDKDPQGPCIIMEYIKGITLDALLLQEGRLAVPRVARLLRQLCEALFAAHAEGIVHRDLKPANVMIVDAGQPYELLKVMDFGLAKLLQPSTLTPQALVAPTGVTNHEFAVGTPGYMCPEQARGEEMDHRGDLYSLGVILFEVLSGRLPFAGKSTMDMLLAHATEEPPTLNNIAPGVVPPAVEEVVLACLAKAPADRPAHAREVAERFEFALANSVAPGRSARSKPPTTPASVAPPRTTALPLPQPQPTPPQNTTPPPDPQTVVHHLEAWMPEKIASYKLRGFIHDKGGEVLESVPGRIRVRLGGRGCAYVAPARNSLSWLGLGRRSGLIDMELRLQRGEAGRDNLLRITVLLRPLAGDLSADAAWRALSSQIFCDLRSYLMGANGVPTDAGAS